MSMASLAAGPVIGSAVAAPIGQEVVGVTIPTQAHVSPLPAGFPAKFVAELAWTGSDFQGRDDYVYKLTAGDLDEIAAAVAYFKGLEKDGTLVSRDNFPLSVLGPKLDELSREVHGGRGFCVVRGLDVARYAVEDLTLVYLGVQSYIADQRGRQDGKGNMLVHIIADKQSQGRRLQHHHRHSNKSITFHNEESGDVVGWLTRSTAASGGKCIIASAYAVYNTLAATRPDLVRLLARSDWPFALPRFHCRPVIFHLDGKLIMNFGRAPLVGTVAHPRPAGLPAVTARQLEALDAIEAVAQATQLEIQTRAGDMHFINNLAVLHRREAFTDGGAPGEQRHLVRMRLRSSTLGWDIPVELKREWHEAFESEAHREWHLEPMPGGYFPLRKYPN